MFRRDSRVMSIKFWDKLNTAVEVEITGLERQVATINYIPDGWGEYRCDSLAVVMEGLWSPPGHPSAVDSAPVFCPNSVVLIIVHPIATVPCNSPPLPPIKSIRRYRYSMNCSLLKK
ncbi:hypothetical protein J6590_047554 [Homalodisca vitripennis]|nr:hypothetical protein J6590_047554 [Homalodisca vitripennis]